MRFKRFSFNKKPLVRFYKDSKKEWEDKDVHKDSKKIIPESDKGERCDDIKPDSDMREIDNDEDFFFDYGYEKRKKIRIGW